MNINDKYVYDIGELILQCEDVVDSHWQLLSVVYDTGEGHTANSGFLYTEDEISPISVSIPGQRFLLRNTILEFRDVVYEETGHKFKQLLIQMEKETGRIKIDFEFDDPDRWAIKPSKLKEMREALRPQFD